MAEPGKTVENGNRALLIKALVLLIMAATAIGLVEFTPIRAYLTPQQFQRIIRDAGALGPALLMIFCFAGTCIFIPGTVFIGIGVAMYGPLNGFACVWPGTLAGAAASFLVARTLGRDFISSIIGDRLRKYDDLIERNGFKAVLFLRLMCVPFAPMNYGMGLTKVRFRDFLFGTAVGITVTIFVIAFFIGSLREIWISGEWGNLFSVRVALSVALLASLLFTPKIIAKIRCRRPSNGGGRSNADRETHLL